jgi:hypothetical protein
MRHACLFEFSAVDSSSSKTAAPAAVQPHSPVIGRPLSEMSPSHACTPKKTTTKEVLLSATSFASNSAAENQAPQIDFALTLWSLSACPSLPLLPAQTTHTPTHPHPHTPLASFCSNTSPARTAPRFPSRSLPLPPNTCCCSCCRCCSLAAAGSHPCQLPSTRRLIAGNLALINSPPPILLRSSSTPLIHHHHHFISPLSSLNNHQLHHQQWLAPSKLPVSYTSTTFHHCDALDACFDSLIAVDGFSLVLQNHGHFCRCTLPPLPSITNFAPLQTFSHDISY